MAVKPTPEKGVIPETRRHKTQPKNHKNNEFRILNFIGDRHDIDDTSKPLKFNFQTLSLDDRILPSYTAISYTWGENPGSTSIVLQGQEVAIPDSAETALRGVISWEVRHSVEQAACLLWIDAVCIDQENLEEKSRQVGMMKGIYCGAGDVCIWLEDGTGGAAFETVEMLAQDCDRWTDDERELGKISWQEKRSQSYWTEPPPDGCDWEAFASLLRAKYFTRLWILQEVVNGKSVTLLCGRNSISWTSFAKAVRWTWHRDFRIYFPRDGNVINESAVNLLIAKEICHLRDTPSQENSLLALLMLNLRSNASNPWDRVFALLGLLDQENSGGVAVDYGRPLKDVYAETMSVVLQNKGDLMPLSLALAAKLPAEEDWPSWVPRFHELHGRQEIATFSRANGCRASGDTASECTYSATGNILYVKGVSVGQVSCVLDLSPLKDVPETHSEDSSSDSEDDSDSEEDQEAAYQRLADAWFSRPQESSHVPASAISEADITSVVAAVNDQKDATEFKLWRKKWCMEDLTALLSTVLKHSSRSSEAMKSLDLAEAQEGDGWGLLGSLWNFVDTLGLSSIIVLEDKRFGFCVGEVKAGDEICLLFGGDLLFVLRAGEGVYRRLCAYALVPGVMEGEHLRQLEQEDRLGSKTREYHIQ